MKRSSTALPRRRWHLPPSPPEGGRGTSSCLPKVMGCGVMDEGDCDEIAAYEEGADGLERQRGVRAERLRFGSLPAI